MTTLAPPHPKLRAPEARALVDAQARYDRAKRELDECKAARDELLAKLTAKLPVGQWITCAGWVIRRTMQPTGMRFRLGEYLEHHKLTAAMRPYVSPSEERPRLWIKPSGQ